MGVFHVFKIVQMVSNHAKHHYLSQLCIGQKWFEEGMGYATFNFRTYYKVEIRFSDNPRQKETIDEII